MNLISFKDLLSIWSLLSWHFEFFFKIIFLCLSLYEIIWKLIWHFNIGFKTLLLQYWIINLLIFLNCISSLGNIPSFCCHTRKVGATKSRPIQARLWSDRLRTNAQVLTPNQVTLHGQSLPILQLRTKYSKLRSLQAQCGYPRQIHWP